MVYNLTEEPVMTLELYYGEKYWLHLLLYRKDYFSYVRNTHFYLHSNSNARKLCFINQSIKNIERILKFFDTKIKKEITNSHYAA